MFKSFKKTIGLGAIVAALTVSMGAYAFTASNTVPATKAGTGAGAVTGYTVSNVVYTFSASGDDVTAVAFKLDSTADSVKVKLVSGGTTWFTCSAPAADTGTPVKYDTSCTVTSTTAASVDQLKVQAQKS